MIHDILLSCMDLTSDTLPIEQLVTSDAVSTFLHPCEKGVLLDIIGIINIIREIAKFAKQYDCGPRLRAEKARTNNDLLPDGLYLGAFASGLNDVLQEYLSDVATLESHYLQNPTHSLLFIYHKLQEYEPLALFLRKLVRGISAHRHHGCGIMEFLHRNTHHGDLRIQRSLKHLQASINLIFLKHLSHWLLYAKVDDNHAEFFIQRYNDRSTTLAQNERDPISGTNLTPCSTPYMDVVSSDIWQYEVWYEMLPSFFSTTFAEKVLFVGQTVLLFQEEMLKRRKKERMWKTAKSRAKTYDERKRHFALVMANYQRELSTDSIAEHMPSKDDMEKKQGEEEIAAAATDAQDKENNVELDSAEREGHSASSKKNRSTPQPLDYAGSISDDDGSLWNRQELNFFKKLQSLQNDKELNVLHYENVVDEIKDYTTARLSEIAVNQADLVAQLKLIKDFYLLSRGELFLEFIRRMYFKSREWSNDNRMREILRTFELSAHSVGIPELDQISLWLPHDECDEAIEFNYVQQVQLIYEINWPLQLLFAPKILNRYNLVFRFLLLVKKMQFELHMIWANQTRAVKSGQPQNIKVLHLRNQLMFFIDNLQYYIQVDVLESSFSVLLHTILDKADFEKIQRAHSVFQANILSLCFLLSTKEADKTGQLPSVGLHSDNPVFKVLNDIFYLCESFCSMVQMQNSEEIINKHVDEIDENLTNAVDRLINLLTELKSSPSTSPLSQFLLRLDFNHWFSSRKKKIQGIN